MLPSSVAQLSIPSLFQPGWILTYQNILGSDVTTVSPPVFMWDGLRVRLSVRVCACGIVIKDRCQT